MCSPMPDIDPDDDFEIPGPCERHPGCDACTCEPVCNYGTVTGSVLLLACATNTCIWPACHDAPQDL